MNTRGTKLAVIGAGAVGTAVAYASLIRGVARTIALMAVSYTHLTLPTM